MAPKNNAAALAIAQDAELEELYGSYSGSAAKEDAAKVARNDYVKLVQGRNIIRILPGPKGAKSPFVEVEQHFLKNSAGKAVVINCPQKMHGGYCPVCDHVETLKHSPVQADKDAAKDIAAKKQIFCYAIHRTPAKDDKPLGILRLPFGAYTKILTMRHDPEVIEAFEENTGKEVDKDEGVDLTHPAYGFDIIIERTGSGMTTKYEAKPKITGMGKTPAMDDVGALKDALKKRPDLASFAKVLSEGEIKSALDNLSAPPASEGGDTKALPEATATAEREMHDTSAVPVDPATGKPVPF